MDLGIAYPTSELIVSENTQRTSVYTDIDLLPGLSDNRKSKLGLFGSEDYYICWLLMHHKNQCSEILAAAWMRISLSTLSCVKDVHLHILQGSNLRYNS